MTRQTRRFRSIGRGVPSVRDALKILTGTTALWLAIVPHPLQAVIFYATGEPSYNTTAPAGDLAESGWQFQGLWGPYLGTPIAPKYFVTAQHVGGAVGDKFIFHGFEYRTSAFLDDPDSDLRIWRVCGTLLSFAPLYTSTNELGRSLVVFGRGTQRGDPVTVTNPPNAGLRGWFWGMQDFVQRWGENVVESVIDGDAGTGGNGVGSLLRATFDANAGTNECHLSTGDSGGAVFIQDIQDGATWKLAGINYGVDGSYKTTSNGTNFWAALFDQGGLYQWDGSGWTLVPELSTNQPSAFYATRISSNLDWIQSVLALPVPPDERPTLQSAFDVAGPYEDERNATVDDTARTLTVPRLDRPQFYRLRACGPLTITSIRVESTIVVIAYE